MSLRLMTALALSLALHGVLLFPGLLKRLSVAPPRSALQATLRLPPVPERPPDESLLKNTIDTEDDASQASKLASPAPVPAAQRSKAKQELQTAQRKVSQYVYYPPEAVARGIEGEVRLILRLADDGTVEDVSVAASSGHLILDNAAIKAVYAMGKLSGVTSRELILPVRFQLE